MALEHSFVFISTWYSVSGDMKTYLTPNLKVNSVYFIPGCRDINQQRLCQLYASSYSSGSLSLGRSDKNNTISFLLNKWYQLCQPPCHSVSVHSLWKKASAANWYGFKRRPGSGTGYCDMCMYRLWNFVVNSRCANTCSMLTEISQFWR